MPALLGCARLCSLCPAGGAAEPAPAPGIKSREGAEKCDRDGAVGRGRKRIGGRRKKKKKTTTNKHYNTRERTKKSRSRRTSGSGGWASWAAGRNLRGCRSSSEPDGFV